MYLCIKKQISFFLNYFYQEMLKTLIIFKLEIIHNIIIYSYKNNKILRRC